MEHEIDLDKEAEKEFRKLRQKETYDTARTLSDEDEEEFLEIKKKIDVIKRDPKHATSLKDTSLKKRIARFALDLVQKTARNEEDIMETANVLAYFARHTFDDGLDAVFELAGELELPEEHVSGDVFSLWKQIEKKLKDYLDD